MADPLPQGSINATDPVEQAVTYQVSTDVNANCKWDTSDTTYALMANTFDSTGTMNHTDINTLAIDTAYIRYYRCKATANEQVNDASAVASFTILDYTPPIEGVEAPTGFQIN